VGLSHPPYVIHQVMTVSWFGKALLATPFHRGSPSPRDCHRWSVATTRRTSCRPL
jgi:hypothetical protein